MSERAFSPLPTEIDLPADGPRWGFFEGPPTANGKPGTHHVEARVVKDLFPRFKTMKGHRVERRAGWYCRGLPVELAVEKELGFAKKQDIEAYGIAEFNARCRESALRHPRHRRFVMPPDGSCWIPTPSTHTTACVSRKSCPAPPLWTDRPGMCRWSLSG